MDKKKLSAFLESLEIMATLAGYHSRCAEEWQERADNGGFSQATDENSCLQFAQISTAQADKYQKQANEIIAKIKAGF